MILDEYVEAKWKSTNKDWYIAKGYILEENNHTILCKPLDLLPKSNIKINVLCDYCHKTINSIPFYTYTKKVLNVPIQKYACSKCRQRKVEEMSLYKKGVKYSHQKTYQQVKEMFKSYNYILLTSEEEYQGLVSQKLKYICPKHGEQYNTYNDLQQGNSCKYCGYEKTAQSKIKYTIDILQKLFNERNYTLISTDIPDNKILKYYCNIHPNEIQDVNLYNFIHLNNGCKYCAIEERANSRRLDFDYVKEIYESNNLILLESEYKNRNTKMKCKCNVHSNIIQKISLSEVIYRTSGCLMCCSENRKGENSFAWKGGITPLHNYLREHIIPWKKDSMKFYNYKCIITNKPFNVIHHLHNFNDIMQESLELLNLPVYSQISDYKENDLKQLENKNLELHYKYGYGVLLTNEIHKLFHHVYGRNNNTPEQFEEFKVRYNNGEFKIPS